MNDRTKHVAGRVDAERVLRFCPPEAPDSVCPGEWAHAFLNSEDKSEIAVLLWFTNAMHAARYGDYPPNPLDDGE